MLEGWYGGKGIEWNEWNESSVIESITGPICLSYE